VPVTTPKRPVGRPRKTPVEGVIAAPAKPQGIRVTISKRTRRGEDPVEEEVVWPRGWPLPDAGTIVLGKELSGWLEHAEMDLVNGRVILVLRPQS
jgi:hypothetical protein